MNVRCIPEDYRSILFVIREYFGLHKNTVEYIIKTCNLRSPITEELGIENV